MLQRSPKMRRTSALLVLVLATLISFSGCKWIKRGSPEQHYQQARTVFERGQLPAALDAADQGLQRYANNPEWAWRFRVQKAEVLVWQGKAKDAIALLEEPLPPSLAASDVAVRRQLIRGIASYHLQRFDDSAAALSNSEALANAGHPELLGDIASAQGTLAIMRADFATGKALNLRALESARSQHKRFLEASAIGNMGYIALREHRWGEAIDLFNSGLPLARELQNETLREKLSLNLGWCYYKVGDYERALALFNDTEAITEKLGLVKDQFIVLDNIGNIHQERGDFEKASSLYQRSLELAQKLENKVAQAAALNNLASSAIETGKLQLAADYNTRARALNHATADQDSEHYSLLNEARIAVGHADYPSAIQTLNNIISSAGDDISLRWEAQSQIANIYAAQHDHARANAQFRTALATIDTARASIKSEEQRLSFLANAKRFYNDYIDFLISERKPDEALKVAEHSRARTLAEGLGLKPASTTTSFNPTSVARADKAVLLYYWLKPGHSYLWAISPERTESFELPPASEIDAKVQEYRKSLLGPRPQEGAHTGQELYNTLVAPAGKLLSSGARVVVIGDGPLNSLNFETLVVPGTQPHYWIEDAVIANANSIALLAAERKRPPRQRNLLLIGNPNYQSPEFQPLPQAGKELKLVEDHFSDSNRRIIAALDAKPQAYAASSPRDFSYIHFVAHATASQTSPLDSSIILTKDGENSRLYARDIMQQPLTADLVTISGCYGAGTRELAGEGLVGLSWAFLRAGAHNVIAALWEVNDASTPQLMDQLYSELDKGEDTADALRAAKLKMLHSGSVYSKPFYWAAFQLYSGS